jgi:hypothetical protein
VLLRAKNAVFIYGTVFGHNRENQQKGVKNVTITIYFRFCRNSYHDSFERLDLKIC